MRRVVGFLMVWLMGAPMAFAAASRNLDGTNDYMTAVSASVTLNTGSYALWLNPDFVMSTATQYYFFDTDTARHVAFHCPTPTCGGSNLIQMYNDGRATDFTGASWTQATWNFFLYTYNKTGNVQQFWLNGTQQTGSNATGTWGSNGLGTKAYIGTRFNAPSAPLDGRVAYIQYHSRQLIDWEIKQIQWAPGSLANGMTSFLPIFGNDSPEIDLSGNGRTATITGTASANIDGPPVFFGGIPL